MLRSVDPHLSCFGSRSRPTEKVGLGLLIVHRGKHTLKHILRLGNTTKSDFKHFKHLTDSVLRHGADSMIILRVIYANTGLAELQISFAINSLHLSAVVLHLSCQG